MKNEIVEIDLYMEQKLKRHFNFNVLTSSRLNLLLLYKLMLCFFSVFSRFLKRYCGLTNIYKIE